MSKVKLPGESELMVFPTLCKFYTLWYVSFLATSNCYDNTGITIAK